MSRGFKPIMMKLTKYSVLLLFAYSNKTSPSGTLSVRLEVGGKLEGLCHSPIHFVLGPCKSNLA